MDKNQLLEKLIAAIKMGISAIIQYNLPTNQDNPDNKIPTMLSIEEINKILLDDSTLILDIKTNINNVDNGILARFQKEEINKMPKKYRNIISTGGSYRQKSNGVHEYRITINGTTISASSKDDRTAIKKFITALAEIDETQTNAQTNNKNKYKNITDFFEYWYETIKKPILKEITYKKDFAMYKTNIKPFFENKQFKNVTPMGIQPLFNELQRQGKTRTAQRIRMVLDQVFKAAVMENLLKQNPINGITAQRHECQNGTALTFKEEQAVINATKNNENLKILILFLYTGIRRSEIIDIKIDKDFVIVKNGKIRKGKRETFRKIPITPMLRPYLPISTETYKDLSTISKYFKKVCPNHHLHDLRHTFISRCQECGVSRELTSVWAGHAADKTMTTTVYTHFSENHMLKEAEKVRY